MKDYDNRHKLWIHPRTIAYQRIRLDPIQFFGLTVDYQQGMDILYLNLQGTRTSSIATTLRYHQGGMNGSRM
jgi:hypothetical protein